jgi:sugar transferase EpsL
MGQPIFFRQARIGRNEIPFTIVKFRTMREPRPGEDRFHTDAERVTRIGHVLRKTSIDELPELWNVLRGHMSLVGPRPLLLEYLDLYSPAQRRRHDVRPGITGLAQVRGRQHLTFSQRLALDVEYVDTRSIRSDLSILFSTFRHVLRRDGIETGQSFADVDDMGIEAHLDAQIRHQRDSR